MYYEIKDQRRIDAKEVVELTERYGYCDSILLAREIRDVFNQANLKENDCHWKDAKLLATVFDAGYIQGIRTERERRKRKR